MGGRLEDASKSEICQRLEDSAIARQAGYNRELAENGSNRGDGCQMQIAGQSLGSFALLILVASLVVLLAYRLARLYRVGEGNDSSPRGWLEGGELH